MNMKKIISTLLAASLMLLGTQAFAQVSVNAGYLNSTQSFSNSNLKSINSNGAYVGLTFNIPVAGGFGIAPGVYYSMITNKNGADGVILGIPASASATFMEHAVNAPLHLNWGVDLARDTKLFIFAGPTFQYGIASKTRLQGGVAGISGDKTYNNYEDDDYNRFNIYAGGGVGMKVAGIQITVGYDYGVMNLYDDDDLKTHRSNIKIGLGYAF